MSEMNQQATVTAIIIAKNESLNLKDCIDSLTWADTVIVFDSGSTDNSQEIVEQLGAEFHQNVDWQGFGNQRQLAQQKISTDWCFWIDADERVTPELASSIQKAIKSDNKTIYSVARRSWVFGRFLSHSGWYPDKVLRLHPTQLTRYNDALVHEKLVIPEKSNVKHLSGDLLHYTYDSIHHYLVKSAGYAKAWADQREAKGKRATLGQGITHAIGCFAKMYLLKRGFLDGKAGFLIAILSAHSTFVKYADLWARENDSHYKK
ncbi:glycosyltransferase family 2 protein [Agarivorans albus]|uniref:Lipopolysaccharide biosynthesis glycosyltransferase n=1 Tax=Agarivorans albus MKT 106 TaxID=1331007 RepID=R9PG75_AGAAL|nr:glycosyltransferase family 2 protein [Agarivorans albus]GAD00375.1 lipopolysaccharide biosynthesis glycosyltransferase [Agarivorans albus MKT 106]